jgi:hypothetical protein
LAVRRALASDGRLDALIRDLRRDEVIATLIGRKSKLDADASASDSLGKEASKKPAAKKASAKKTSAKETSAKKVPAKADEAEPKSAIKKAATKTAGKAKKPPKGKDKKDD